MAKRNTETADPATEAGILEKLPLWQLDIAEVAGHNLEARGREEVNRLLAEGWLLLHIYTLKYHEDDVWRERPMAILGKLRKAQHKNNEDSDRTQLEPPGRSFKA